MAGRNPNDDGWGGLTKEFGGGGNFGAPGGGAPRIIARPSCTRIAINGALNGGVIGGVFGAVMGGYESYTSGYRGTYMYQHIGRRALSNAANFAVFLGTFRGVKCGMQSYRRKKDVINTFVAGFCAGALSTAITTRDPRSIGVNAAISGLFMSVIGSIPF
eukprot:GEZU01027844.1.p2 GENE.GEZU01027844.1~~GEZU01027844.1.p2  ORF type:complete len:160 (+),score=30.65 GEZU01027844.1:86-565(+)